jgi:hypothetical protein
VPGHAEMAHVREKAGVIASRVPRHITAIATAQLFRLASSSAAAMTFLACSCAIGGPYGARCAWTMPAHVAHSRSGALRRPLHLTDGPGAGSVDTAARIRYAIP